MSLYGFSCTAIFSCAWPTRPLSLLTRGGEDIDQTTATAEQEHARPLSLSLRHPCLLSACQASSK